jgi:hypothetical protein
MTDDNEQSPVEAFDSLRQEVALLRRAMEQWVGERGATPDYTETLGKIMRDMKAASKGMDWLVHRPAIQTTAEQLAGQISDAGEEARAEDRETVLTATRSLTQSIREIDGYVIRARLAELQNQRLGQVGLGAVGVGAVIGILIVFGTLHLAPEHGAAWILGLNRWEAGERLLASANYKSWSEIKFAASLINNNRQSVLACSKLADRSGVAQKCRVVIMPHNN